MKKYSYMLMCAVMIAAVSCSKERIDVPVQDNVQSISLIASFGDTKVAYTEDSGIKQSFEVGDKIAVFSSTGDSVVFKAITVNEGVANFVSHTTKVNPFVDGSNVNAVLLNYAIKAYDSETKNVTVSYQGQWGTLASAGSYTLVCGSGTYHAGGETTITFVNKSTIYKMVLSVPAGENPTSGKNWYLSTGGTGSKDYYNGELYNVLTGDETLTPQVNDGTKGDISFIYSSPAKEGKFVVYFAAPVTKLKKGIIQCTPDTDATKRYVWHLAGETALVPEAGKTYTVTRTAPVIRVSSSSSLYLVNNNAQTVNGTDLPANTTGKPKTTLTTGDAWGYTYNLNVTQVEVADLKGNYKFYSKGFKVWNAAGTSQSSIQSCCLDVVFGDPRDTNEYTDSNSKSHTNNIGISGLYWDAIMDACVEIDYAPSNEIRFGLFFDYSHPQIRRSSASATTYCAFVPELCASPWKTYTFAPNSFGSSNHEWLWFNYVGLSTIKYQFTNENSQALNTACKISSKYVCGISVVTAESSDGESFTFANASDQSKYDTIYQANYNANNKSGLYFERQ